MVDTHSPATASSAPGAGRIIITTLMAAINSTAPSPERPLSVATNNTQLSSRIRLIPAAIARYWNAKPLKLDITDSTCGQNIYEIVFDPQIVLSSGGRMGGVHYNVEMVNVPPQPAPNTLGPLIPRQSVLQGQSYVSGYSAVFNIGESRSGTDGRVPSRRNPQADILEAHEYGHMLGLKDEYNDTRLNRGGVDYVLPDSTVQNASGQQHLMDTMVNEQEARQARYASTIAYAVQDILNRNGRRVSRNRIIGDYI